MSVVHVSSYFPNLLRIDLEEVCKALGYICGVTLLYKQVNSTDFFIICLAEQN